MTIREIGRQIQTGQDLVETMLHSRLSSKTLSVTYCLTPMQKKDLKKLHTLGQQESLVVLFW